MVMRSTMKEDSQDHRQLLQGAKGSTSLSTPATTAVSPRSASSPSTNQRSREKYGGQQRPHDDQTSQSATSHAIIQSDFERSQSQRSLNTQNSGGSGGSSYRHHHHRLGSGRYNVNHHSSTGSIGSNTTLESNSSSIWSRIEEDERRKARLRNRLASFRHASDSMASGDLSTTASVSNSKNSNCDQSVDTDMAQADDFSATGQTRHLEQQQQQAAMSPATFTKISNPGRIPSATRRLASITPSVALPSTGAVVEPDSVESSLNEPTSAAVNSALYQQASTTNSSASPPNAVVANTQPDHRHSRSQSSTHPVSQNSSVHNTPIRQIPKNLDPEKAKLLMDYGAAAANGLVSPRISSASPRGSGGAGARALRRIRRHQQSLSGNSPRGSAASANVPNSMQGLQDMESKIRIGDQNPSSNGAPLGTSQISADMEIKRQEREWEAQLLGNAAAASSNSQTPAMRRPGAFSVAGSNSTEASTAVAATDLPTPFSPTQPVRPTIGERDLQSRRPSSMPVAAVVVEDFEHEALTEKEQELKQKEAALAARMAELRAYEEELNRRRQDLELRSSGGALTSNLATANIVQAEVVGTAYNDTINSSQPRSGTWMFSSANGEPGTVTSSLAGSSQAEEVSVDGSGPGSHRTGASFPLVLAHSNERVDINAAYTHLGPGPIRFALQNERSLEEQLIELIPSNRRAYKQLKQRWEDRKAKNRSKGAKQGTFDLPIEFYLRYLRMYTRNDGSFSCERSWNSLKKVRPRFVQLNIFALQAQLESKTLFPVPGLRTKEGHDMFYMRPSRYFPGKTTTRMIIDNLCYVMNTMLEKESAQLHGIGFIACMDNWKMRNFEVNYCYQFMMALQGFMVPVKTQLFLIVNPPAWFGVIWKIMKPMLAPSFRKRVKICNESKIAKYLEPGYETYLPDDMRVGQGPTDEMIKDFVAYRNFAEQDVLQRPNSLVEDSESTDYNSQDGMVMPMAVPQSSGRSRNKVWKRSNSRGSGASAVGGVSRFRDDNDSLETMSWAERSISETGSHAGSHGDDDASIEADIHHEHLLEDEDVKQASTSQRPPMDSQRLS